MKVFIKDIHKRLQYLPESTLAKSSKISTFIERAVQANYPNEIMRLIEIACKDTTNSMPIATVLDLYDKLYEMGTVSDIKTAANRICHEYVDRTRDAKETQTYIRGKLSRAFNKTSNRIASNLDDIKSTIHGTINKAKKNLNTNTNKVKNNISTGLGKKDKKEEAKTEAYISGLISMDEAATRALHCDRILENYNRVSKRFNIDKVIWENYPINGIEDTVVEIANLIETYNVSDNIKFNTLLETCWYGFQKNGIPFNQSAMVTTAADYFMAKGKNHNMCCNLLENSLVISKKDYNGSDLSVITEEEPEEDQFSEATLASDSDIKNISRDIVSYLKKNAKTVDNSMSPTLYEVENATIIIEIYNQNQEYRISHINQLNELKRNLEVSDVVKKYAKYINKIECGDGDEGCIYIHLKHKNFFYLLRKEATETYFYEATNISNYKGYRVETVDTKNPNDWVSQTAVSISFYKENNKIGEVSISGIDTESPFIYDLEVSKAYRGNGYGTMIMRYIIDTYKANELVVNADNEPAINLYKKFGFKSIKEFEDNGIPSYHMARDRSKIAKSETAVVEGKLSFKDRKGLSSSDYGLPKKKKYPMPDESHVRAAIRMFNHVDKEDEEELARNIKRKIKEFKIKDIEIGDKNRFSKYFYSSKKEGYVPEINDYIREYATGFSGGHILKEDVDFNRIFADFKTSDDEHKENKLPFLIRKLYTRKPQEIINGTPALLDYIRIVLIIGGAAINPILGAIGLIADIFIKLKVDKEETNKMRTCFKNEINKTQTKLNSAKSTEEKDRLQKYLNSLNDGYKKIDEYYEELLTDDELDKKYDEDHKDDNTNDDDGFDFGDDFDDFDDLDDFDEAVKGIVYMSNLLTLRESMPVYSFGKSACSIILRKNPSMIDYLSEVSQKAPSIIDPRILAESINDILNEGDTNQIHLSFIDRSNLNLALKECYSYQTPTNPSIDIFSQVNHIYAENMIIEGISDIITNYATYSPIQEFSIGNSIKLASEKVKKGLQKLSDKDKTISKNIDISANNFQKAVERSLTSDNRAAVIKGSILPSASKTLKLCLGGLAGAIIFDPVIAVIGVLGYLGTSAKFKYKERQMVLDEIETELKMCEKYIALAEDKNDMKALRKLYTIQRDLERQRQRIKYKMKVDFGQKYYDADQSLQNMK